jgi:two-component system, LytTR family, sensor kinase
VPLPLITHRSAGASAAHDIGYPGIPRVLLVWCVIGALTSIRHHVALGRLSSQWEIVSGIIGCMACYLPWAVLTPIVFRIEQRYPLGAARWPRRLAILTALSVPVCMLASPVMFVSFAAVRYLLHAEAWWPRGGFFLFAEFSFAEALFWSSVAGGYLIRTQFQLREQEQRAAFLEAGLNQAQLEVLRARLNPHFLFNSLQNIAVLTKQDPQTASRMLIRLGDLLRTVLRQDSQPETSLREEVELTRAYVALEQMRFGDRLQVTFAVARDVEQALVPCFLLQPLLENAIVHGLRGAAKTGVIAVSAFSQDAALILTVTDNGSGLPSDEPAGIKVGVGLRSTCERLERMYAERHSFSIRTPDIGGVEVHISIPLSMPALPEHLTQDGQFAVTDRR